MSPFIGSEGRKRAAIRRHLYLAGKEVYRSELSLASWIVEKDFSRCSCNGNIVGRPGDAGDGAIAKVSRCCRYGVAIENNTERVANQPLRSSVRAER